MGNDLKREIIEGSLAYLAVYDRSLTSRVPQRAQGRGGEHDGVLARQPRETSESHAGLQRGDRAYQEGREEGERHAPF